MSKTSLVTAGGNALAYAMAAWLHAKAARTGSKKTQRAYEDTITRFRAALQRAGLDLDSDPARVADVAQVRAGAPWDVTRQSVTANTHNQRLAILSRFYTFAHKRRILSGENPIALVDRKPVQRYAGARAIESVTVSENMSLIDRGTLFRQARLCLVGDCPVHRATAFRTGGHPLGRYEVGWGAGND